MDPDHQRRVALVAETCALAVPAAIAGIVSGHRHAVAARQQERPCAPRDRQCHRSLPGRTAGVLDFQLPRTRPDRLELRADARCGAVTGIEADQRGGSDLGEH